MTDQKPKPCPFCGGTDIIFVTHAPDNPDVTAMCCRKCGCGGPLVYKRGGKEEMVAAWNRRTPCKACAKQTSMSDYVGGD